MTRPVIAIRSMHPVKEFLAVVGFFAVLAGVVALVLAAVG